MQNSKCKMQNFAICTPRLKNVTLLMREILFRGKRKDNGEWVYGGICQTESWTTIDVVNDYERGLYEPPSCDVCDYEVIPETVGQYTSLIDKNGKKMYEGDIVAGAVRWLDKPKNGVVAFRYGSFGLVWYLGQVEHFHPFVSMCFASMCNVEYEVIGNIYDNPELSKGGAE